MGNIVTDIWGMEDLRKRVLFTLGLLGIYRMGIFVPIPGVNRLVLAEYFAQQSQNGGGVLGLYDMFTGGALQRFSVFFLGIMPYITASIVMQILTQMVPALERVQKEGQTGRNTITQYTRYLTIAISIVQGTFMAQGLEHMRVGNQTVVIDPGLGFTIMTVLTVTAGSCFIMWLGEQISERGIGNGSSILITTGIIARLPDSANRLFTLIQIGEMNLLFASLMLMGMFGTICFIVYVERAQRRIPIQYAKRVLGRRAYEGQTTHLPLKINTSGSVPPIFASSLLMLPATVGTFAQNQFVDYLSQAFYPGRWLYNIAYLGLITFFSFFYTAVTFSPVDVAENLKKQGGYIPRIRPGKETAEYIDRLLTRLTSAGAVYLAMVCILPSFLMNDAGFDFQFGGTSLIILVGVSLDTVAQIEAHLMTRHYDGLVGPKGQRVKGRRRLLTAGTGAKV